MRLIIKILAITTTLGFANCYAACEVNGCNGELCTKAGEHPFSTCLWKAEYPCYRQYGVCEEDANGECNWKPTAELQACVKAALHAVEASDTSSD